MNCEWIGWCALNAAEQAAWMQAIGSVGAILVAAYIPTRIANREAKRRDNEQAYRAKSLSFILRPLVDRMTTQVNGAQSRWAKCPTNYDDDEVVEGLIVPAELSAHLLEFHVLGEAGTSVQRAIVDFEHIRTAVYTQYTHWRYGGMYVDFETGEEFELQEPEDVQKSFNRAKAQLAKAYTELTAILNS